MPVIQNKWIEKERKKKDRPETAPAFEAAPIDNWLPIKPGKKVARHTNAARASLVRTLRGIRK